MMMTPLLRWNNSRRSRSRHDPRLGKRSLSALRLLAGPNCSMHSLPFVLVGVVLPPLFRIVVERGHLLLNALMPNLVIASIFRALCNITEGLTRTNSRAHEEELLGLEVKLKRTSRCPNAFLANKSWAAKKPRAAKKPKLTSNCHFRRERPPDL